MKPMIDDVTKALDRLVRCISNETDWTEYSEEFGDAYWDARRLLERIVAESPASQSEPPQKPSPTIDIGGRTITLGVELPKNMPRKVQRLPFIAP